MKSGYILRAGVVISGAVIGMTLAHSDLSSRGVIFGALAGVIFAILFILPAGSHVSSIPPDMHE